MRRPSLTGLRAFNAAAELLSFKEAARSLAVTPAALSFQIRQLEQVTGTALFSRRHRQVQLTAAGRLIQEDIRAGFACFDRAFAHLERQQQVQALTVACGPVFSANWLSPRLHKFLLQQPDLDTRILASLKLCDLHQDDVDVALRFSSAEQPGCRVFKLADDYVLPLCSPSLLKAGGLEAPSDLANHTLIHSEDNEPGLKLQGWRDWLVAAGADDVDSTRSGLHFNVASHALNAAIEGAGVVLGRETLALRDIDAGRLVRPFDLRLKNEFSFYAVVLKEREHEPAIAAFLRWVQQEAAGEEG